MTRWWPLLLVLACAGCELADADELLFGPPVGSGVVSLPFDATQSPGCMSWDGTNIDTHPSNPTCAGGGGSPAPTVTPFACGTGYAVQVVGATPGCVLLPTPDGAGAGAAATQTPWSCGAGNGARGMGGTPECFVVPTPDGSVATVTPGGGTPQPIATSTSAPGSAAGFARVDHVHHIADGAIGAAKLAFTVPTPDGTPNPGDVTAVGSCTDGACLTDGKATSGSTLVVWEGSTVDGNQLTINAGSSDPAAAHILVVPDTDGILVATVDGAEQDPQVGTRTSGAYCKGDGSAVQCTTTTVELASGGTGAALTDPNADRIMFWDDSAGATAYLELSTGLAIQGTAIVAVTPVYYVTPTPTVSATVTPTATVTATPTVTVTITPVACATDALGRGGMIGAHPEQCGVPVATITATPTATVTATAVACAANSYDAVIGPDVGATCVPAVTPVYYVTPTPYPTWTPGPTPTEPFLRYWFLPTTVPASTPPGLMLHRNDLPGPPLVGTPTATATFTPGGGVATVTPTPTPTFTTGGGAATPTATLSATPTPTVTATPIGRQAVYDTLGVRTLASLDDLLDLQIGSTYAANGINVRALNFDSADFASMTCTGSPPTCTIALNSNVMRSTTTLLNSQLPTPLIRSDDQDVCWGTDQDFCIRWVSASSKATVTGLPEFAGNLQFLKEVDHAFTVNATTSSNTNGGGFTFTAANGNGLAAGGSLTFTAGSGLDGGDITFTPAGFSNGDIILNTTASGAVLLSATNAATVGGRRHTTSNTAGVSATFRSGSATASATDKAAGDAILGAGTSTGTGNAVVRLQGRAKATSTSTADNAVNDRLVITGAKAVTDASATSIVDINIASNAMAGGLLLVTCESTNATDYQAVTGMAMFSGVNKGGVMTCTATEQGADVVASSSGTPTIAFAATTGTAKCVLQVTCDTTFASPSTGYPRVTYQVQLNSGFGSTVTPL